MFELIVAIGFVLLYLAGIVITASIFDRKGQSAFLGAALSVFLPVISLIVALVMPYDQPALEERKQRALIDQQRDRERFAKFQQDYNARHAAPAPLPPLDAYEEPPALAWTQTICGILLIACPLAAAMQPGETATAVLGLVSFLALDGLILALFFPVNPKATPDV